MKRFALTKSIIFALTSTALLLCVSLTVQQAPFSPKGIAQVLGVGHSGVESGGALVHEDRTYAEQSQGSDNDNGNENDQTPNLSLRPVLQSLGDGGGSPCSSTEGTVLSQPKGDRGNLNSTDAQNADCFAEPRNDNTLSSVIPAYEPAFGSEAQARRESRAWIPGPNFAEASSGKQARNDKGGVVLSDSISLQPQPVDFSNSGLTEYQLNSIIAQQLTNLASIGLLGSGPRPASESASGAGSPAAYNSTTLQPTTAPVITYIQPAPAQNFNGASLLSATDLSSTRFTTTTANITDIATIKTLSVTENASIDGDLTITGNITGNVIGTINPSFTLGSIPFQGASGLTQDNANFFWDDTNNRLGVGTATPGSRLHVNGNIQQTAGYGGQVVISTSALNYTAPRFGSGVLINGTIGSSGDDEASVIIGGSSFGGDNSYFNTLVGPSANTAGNINGAVVIGAYASHRANNGSGVAVGRSATTDAFSVALGYAATITGTASIALGNSSVVVGNNSASFGAGTVTGASLFSYGGSATKHGFGTVLPGSKVEIKGTGATSATSSLNVTNSSGTSMLYVRDDGNVGIGTTSPASAKVEIKDAGTSASALLRITSDDENPYGLVLGNDTYSTNYLNGFKIYQDNTGLAKISNGGAAILMSGTVGINTSIAPTSRFAVNGNAAFGTYTAAPTNGLAVSGQVSIGTTSASSTLDVIGAMYSGATPTNTVFNGTVATNAANFIATNGYWALRTAVNNSYNLDVYNSGTPIAAMTVLQSGNVGIGTTSPSKLLTVGGGTGNPVLGIDGGTGTAGGYITFMKGGSATSYVGTDSGINGNNNGDLALYSLANIRLHANAGSVSLFIQSSTGNVGAGTISPSTKLHVALSSNTAAEILRLDNTGAAAANTGSYASFFANSSEVARVKGLNTSSGNVGQITLSPIYAGSETAGINIVASSSGNSYIGINTTAGNSELTVKSPYNGATILSLLNYASVERFTVLDTGNVGIGTTAPDTKLHVTGTIKTGLTGTAGRLELARSSDGVSVGALYASGSSLNVDSPGGDINFLPGSVQQMVVKVGGNVGIGTTGPTQKLEVNGNILVNKGTLNRTSYLSDNGLFMSRTSDGSYQSSITADGNMTFNTRNDYTFNTDTVPRLSIINATGFVGVGEVAPGSKLSVSGGMSVGASYDTTAAPTDGMIIQGNIGIGTTAPTTKLHVNGTVFATGQTAPSGGAGVELTYVGGAGYVDAYDYTTPGYKPLRVDGSVLALQSQSTGNVGIGTTSPTLGKLQIQGGSDSSGELAALTLRHGGTQVGDNVSLAFNPAVLSGAKIMASAPGSQNVDFSFYTLNAGVAQESVRISGNGNVGIGTTSPGEKLSLKGADPAIKIENTSAAAWLLQTLDSNGAFRIRESGVGDRITILTGGNVGIGTTSPGAGLDVVNSSIVQQFRLADVTTNSTIKQASISTRHYTNSEEDFGILYALSTSSDNKIILGGAQNGWNAATEISFWTGATNTTTLGSQKMVVTSSGNVGIGTTSPSQLLHVYRPTGGVVARFTDSDGSCDIDPTSTALVCASDATLKTDVTTLQGVLSKLQGMRGVSFRWKTQDDAALRIGVIAQEVEQAFPELVKTDTTTGIKSVNYTGLAPILLQAVKEQQDEIALLQNQVAALQGMNSLSSATPITLRSHLYLSSDSVGQAKILAGSTSVRITFSQPYEQQPIVTATPLGVHRGMAYGVTDIDATGFTVEIDRTDMTTATDVTFNYHVFASSEAKLTVSDGNSQPITLVVPTPSNSPLNQGENPAPLEDSPHQSETSGTGQAGTGQAPTAEDPVPTPTPEGEVAGESAPPVESVTP